jgi:Type I phosphodiesterase / nucleotide pyrophosphatase
MTSSPTKAARLVRLGAVFVGLAALVGLAVVLLYRSGAAPVPSFRRQACSLPPAWIERTVDGYKPGRSGEIQILAKEPAYFASGEGGWTHSGPWPYLQDVPLVFYGPGVVPEGVASGRPVTVADIAPTLARLIGSEIETDDGHVLDEVLDGRADRPTLIVTIVWDGGGWNAINQWPEAWPNLKQLMADGVSYTNAVVGSSPSVTPSIHTTIGTGVFPATHGITDIPVFNDDGVVVDAFMEGESSQLMEAPALAEVWDEQNDNEALVGMIGYEPWHLGMIGGGAERPGGDHDDAVWLNIETNEWITNPDHYRLPEAITSTGGLDADLRRLDAADGQIDGAWGEHEILESPDRVEEVPAFITYHGRVMRNLIAADGYGDDAITDLLFTNFKQIDRVGHYFSMAADEVRQSIVESDRQLGLLTRWLDSEVGRGKYVVVVTADHGQQPDAETIGGYGINPREVESDIAARFGEVVRQVRPTQIFLQKDNIDDDEEDDVAADVARFLADYRLEDNTNDPRFLLSGAGEFDRADRLFDLVVPSKILARIDCSRRQ